MVRDESRDESQDIGVEEEVVEQTGDMAINGADDFAF